MSTTISKNLNCRQNRLPQIFVLSLLAAAIVAVSADELPGQVRKKTTKPASSFGATHGEVFKWFDRYLRRSAILTKEEVSDVREKIALMSPGDLERWLDETKELRAFIESDSWQQTKDWLGDFLKVQAIYSDEEIEELHGKIIDATPTELLEILEKIQNKHRTLSFMHRSSTANRAASLKGREQTLKSASAAASSARKTTSGSNQPLFGSTQGTTASKPKPHQGYSPPKPLITSKSVAREAVRREVYPGRNGWGWGW